MHKIQRAVVKVDENRLLDEGSRSRTAAPLHLPLLGPDRAAQDLTEVPSYGGRWDVGKK